MDQTTLNDDSARLLWRIRCQLSRVEPDLAEATNLIDEALDGFLAHHQQESAPSADVR